jgi:glycine/D-amino acid oxidase-like deaminating enzyme
MPVRINDDWYPLCTSCQDSTITQADMTYDIVIAGNGILGSSAAFLLSLNDPGLRIALVGPQSRKGAASVAAGAMLNLFAELEPDSLFSAPGRLKFDLGLEAQRRWRAHLDLISEHAGERPLAIQPGTFIINNSRSDALDDRSFEAVVDALERYSQPFEHVDPKTIAGYAPAPAHRALRAVYLPNEGSVPSKRLFATLDKAVASRANITRLDALVTCVRPTGAGHGVTLSSGERLTTAQLLLANGAAAQPLIDQLPELAARMPRLFYGVGCGLVLRPPVNLQTVVRTNNRGLACGLHTVPDAEDGTCYVGASNFISPTPEYAVRAGSIQTLLTGAIDEINTSWYKAQVEEVRVGHRPTSADLFPLIGPTSVDGLFVLNGTKRDGLFMSPVYAPAIVDSMLRGGECFDGVFAPERGLITTMTREEGIAKGIAHLWSGGYQHDLRLPRAGWDGHIDRMLEHRVLDAYEKSGNPDYGIPPELLDMYRYNHVRSAQKVS